MPPLAPGLHQGPGAGQGWSEKVRQIEQALASALGFLKQSLQLLAGHAAEGHPRHRGSGGGQGLHQGEGVGIGAPGQLQGAGGGEGTHGAQKAHGRLGGARPHIAAHGSAVQLPEGSQPGGAQQGKPLPELPGQQSGVGFLALWEMALKAAAHRQPLQGKVGAAHLLQPLGKGGVAPDLGVEFHRIGPQGRQQGADGVGRQERLALLDQAEGAGGQAAPAAVAALGHHPPLRRDGQGGADPLAGAGAGGRAAAGIKPGLAEMGIGPVAEAHHQPGPLGAPLLSPGDAAAGGGHHGRIGGQIQAMDAGEAVDAGQIFDGLQILIAGAADPFHPAPAGQGVSRAGPRRGRRWGEGGSRGAALRHTSLLQGWGCGGGWLDQERGRLQLKKQKSSDSF